MTIFPVSLSLSGRKTVVAGGNKQACAIAQELLGAGAIVTLVSAQSDEALPVGVNHIKRNLTPSDLDDCWLVVAATKTENYAIADLCETRRVFCYVPTDDNVSSWQPNASQNASELTITPEIQIATQQSGFVSLVGAGPGHPDLLTVRALNLIKTADAIVYDRLVSDPIMALCNPDAELIYAGKEKANHSLPQHSINALLVELASQHKSVVRLKGGDPFIFGRGGEEIETLADHNVPFQVIPGITAASGCASFAGIPLTHRDHAQSCIFVTGHLRDEKKVNLNWQELKDPTQTIVVYMGLTGIDVICRSLIEHGRAADTPAALVERGTKPEQRVLSSTLEHLPTVVAENKVTPPTLLIIGGVVSLRDKLQWFCELS